MSAGKIGCWLAVGVGLTTGCLGYPDALPRPLEGSSEGTDTMTGEGTTLDETQGPIAECGNDVVEEGEDCDGTDANGPSCADLGLSGGVLPCVQCQLDASTCGPPGMVEVPGGTFEMGSDVEGVDPDEAPVRQVHVDTFWIDETEVTVEAYAACMNAPGAPCSEPQPPMMEVTCNSMMEGRELHPVNCLTWSQAQAYCAWVDGGTKRLPTEAEWEKAARGTDARTYAWGETIATCSYAVMDEPGAGGPGCGTNATVQVGSKPLGASPYGAHDMAGNVWEWVSDWHADSYDDDDTNNPTGPAAGTERVRRGGSLATNAAYLRASNRGFATVRPDELHLVGARCVWTPLASR
jgi:sulfatase modifying factor 1